MNTLKKGMQRRLFWVIITFAFLGLLGFLFFQIFSPQFSANAQNRVAFPFLNLTLVADGLDRPVAIAHAGDGSGRLFIVEQRGRIYILAEDLSATSFLNIEDRVESPASGGGGEQGLLGLAFPPEYETKRYFYIYYTMKQTDNDNVVSRFYLDPDTDLPDPASEEKLFVLYHPDQYTNHNGGQLAFGPDGYLYIGTGDGGGGGDPEGNAQDLGSLNGKVLRIDVESPTTGSEVYKIPPSNPSFADPSQDEIWAYGLRNPWRFSFDRQTGDLYIADVGQNEWEEVNFQAASSPGGENYGWNIMEGEACYDKTTCNTIGLTLPVLTYKHGGVPNNCSVTGGYVYRGDEHPALAGIYIFGDFCSGRIWGLQQDGGAWVHQLMADTSLRISSFGEDEEGELYVADITGGAVYQLAPRYWFFPLILK